MELKTNRQNQLKFVKTKNPSLNHKIKSANTSNEWKTTGVIFLTKYRR